MPPAESSETPKYNLPPPVSESASEGIDNQVESKTARPEGSNNLKAPKSSSSKTQLTDFNLKSSATPQPVSPVSTTQSSSNPVVADDNDLIEKEWVSKAKKIIEDNREDPYNQSKEMTLYKADYMKKRYNKVIKVSE